MIPTISTSMKKNLIMKKILVPCDFSVTSTQAFKFAANIVRQSKGEIILLHIVELPVLRHGPVPINALEKSYLKKIRESVISDVDKMINKWGTGIKVSFVLDHGEVNHTITRHIKKHKIDVIVMGTHGASGIREFFIGSNAEKIVRFASVPVITVKKQFKNKIKNIAFATDLSILPSSASERLKTLQKFFKANLHIVYVNTPFNFKTDESLQPKITEFLNKNGFKDSSFTICNDQDEVSGIRNFAKRINADLVALPTQGKKGLSHFLFGSIAENVTNHIECPLWTCSTES
jgi:nucleotide-binding universal stress UspA family protein